MSGPVHSRTDVALERARCVNADQCHQMHYDADAHREVLDALGRGMRLAAERSSATADELAEAHRRIQLARAVLAGNHPDRTGLALAALNGADVTDPPGGAQ